MFVDASALVAMLTREDDAESLARRLQNAPSRVTSAIAVFEAAMAVARKREWSPDEAGALVTRFLGIASIDIIGLGAREGEAAIEAFERFGKGRHAARLNMGDCFAYACAKTHGLPLLFKGDDFAKTDIAAA